MWSTWSRSRDDLDSACTQEGVFLTKLYVVLQSSIRQGRVSSCTQEMNDR